MSKAKEISQDRHGLIKLMRAVAHSRSLYDVFRDFVEVSALAISNSVDIGQRDGREKRYLEIIKPYGAEDVTRFAQMLGCLVGELEKGYSDALGQTFMELEIANKNTGQFFTPYHLCKVMAQLTLDDGVKAAVERQGFVTVCEPASGGGATVIAFAEAMKDAGLNPQTQMHITAQDLDPRSVHMTYLQLSLFNIPAIVTCGDTLRLTETSRWYTPAHILGCWNLRLRSRGAREQSAAITTETKAAPVEVNVMLPPVGEQIALFPEAA